MTSNMGFGRVSVKVWNSGPEKVKLNVKDSTGEFKRQMPRGGEKFELLILMNSTVTYTVNAGKTSRTFRGVFRCVRVARVG